MWPVSLLSLPVALARFTYRAATFPARTTARLTVFVAEDLLEALRGSPAVAVEDPRPAAAADGPAPTPVQTPSVAPVQPSIARRPRARRGASTPGIRAPRERAREQAPPPHAPGEQPDAAPPAPAETVDRGERVGRSAPTEPAARTGGRAREQGAAPAETSPPAGGDGATAEDHVDTGAVLVAESAEAGAEDGAGAEIRVEAPWPGYGRLRAREVIDRVRAQDEAALTVLLLYERAHRSRRSVIEAAERELAGRR